MTVDPTTGRAAPLGRARTPRKEATRRRLLDAARTVFAERGIAVATLEEICERAGFTRGAFYSNFADKEELVAELLQREEERLIHQLDLITQEPLHSIDEVEQTLEQFLGSRVIDREYYLIQSELALFAVRDARYATLLTEAQTRFKQRLGTVLRRFLDGLGRELVLDEDPTVELILAIFERSNRRDLLDGRPFSDDLARVTFPVLVSAVSRPRAATGRA